MQFHLNGFQTGDPELHPAADRREGQADQVDVLIVGTGPAGLTLAAQLAAFPSIRTRIIEQRDGPLLLGQADGVACRSVEMMNAFGFAERLLKEACWVNETTFWGPDEADPTRITRTGIIQDTEDGLSEFPHVILNQARVHDFYLDVMRKSPTRLEVDYSRRLSGLEVLPPDQAGPLDHAVTARIERLDPGHEGEVETIRARYVVGCDGARSIVRKSIGRELVGDAANKAWGVMDVLYRTDFPDIRKKSMIQSADQGSIVMIPREGGYVTRIYVEMDKLGKDERVAGRNIGIEQLTAAINRVLHPFTIEVRDVAWWSVYEIGQRLTDKFDDVPKADIATRMPHVFIAGDACHTHSPKAGQGMNVSMRDAFNLGWKLAAVLEGRSDPSLLHSYSAERQGVAKMLIDFDREWAAIISAKPKIGDKAATGGLSAAEIRDYWIRHGRYTAGTAIRYAPSVITGTGDHQHLAQGFPVGMRFHSAPVIRLADAKPVHLGHVALADGRWRLFAFGDAANPAGASGIRALCNWLGDDPASPLRKFTPEGADPDAVIDVRAIFQQGHRDLETGDMPSLLRPEKGRFQVVDHEKMFCPDLKAKQDIFQMRGIDRTKGCMVIVRPDQHVAHVLPLDGFDELAGFFAAILRIP